MWVLLRDTLSLSGFLRRQSALQHLSEQNLGALYLTPSRFEKNSIPQVTQMITATLL